MTAVKIREADMALEPRNTGVVIVERVAGIRDRKLWPGLTTVGMCSRERTVHGETSTEVWYFIGSRRMSAR